MTDKSTVGDVSSDLRYLQLLARSFPNVAAASTEIINLEAILNLPKGTEHYLADLHGEYRAFQHVLRNASGSIKRKVREIFGETLTSRDRKELCTLIYYPQLKLDLVKQGLRGDDLAEWYFITLNRLVLVCRSVSSKYTRSKVQKALPRDYAYIIQELLHESTIDTDKQAYVEVIVRTIIATGRADHFIISMCNLIQQLAIDVLHILGDIFDRGPSPHKIMDMLCDYHNFDIQWGNHDLLWIGAAAGNDCCIANAVRLTLRYANQAVLEEGYGINLLPLHTFAVETYADDPCTLFMPRTTRHSAGLDSKTQQLTAKWHKAITVIQLKLEAAAIKNHPEYGMDDRMLLHHINWDAGTVNIAGQDYALSDNNLPTVDPADPYRLSAEEADVVARLHRSFIRSEKLQRHITCLLRNGSMHLVLNSNLLFHASVPLNADGTLKDVEIEGEKFHGRALLTRITQIVRDAYYGSNDSARHSSALDYMWYLWCGKDSPAFDKSKMATFERYFVADKSTWTETKGAYYTLRDTEATCDMLLDEFGVTGEHRHIINGHVPVRFIRGESPIKAGGKMMVIDGGFSEAYQPETGIAGYTLVYHSRGFELVQHEPFTSITRAVTEGLDIKSTTQIVELSASRVMVKDTDLGEKLKRQADDLRKLLYAYEHGYIAERDSHGRGRQR